MTDTCMLAVHRPVGSTPADSQPITSKTAPRPLPSSPTIRRTRRPPARPLAFPTTDPTLSFISLKATRMQTFRPPGSTFWVPSAPRVVQEEVLASCSDDSPSTKVQSPLESPWAHVSFFTSICNDYYTQRYNGLSELSQFSSNRLDHVKNDRQRFLL